MARVLMTADAIGGVWQYSLELACGLARRGTDVLLAVMGSGMNETRRDEVSRLPNVLLAEKNCKLEWMDAPWDDVLESGAWLLNLANEFAPDVIHLNGYAHASLPWNVPVVVAAHSCVLSWFGAVRGAAASDSWTPYKEAVRRGLHAADLVISPSRFMLEQIEFFYGELQNTRLIANGRDPHLFQPGPKEDFILAAGRLWDDAKNFTVLAEAASELPWPVFLAGNAQHPEGGTRTIPGLRLLGELDFVALRDWYARASIYAAPAVYEPFGLTVLEAALSGCALVLSDIPSFREIWGAAACYVDPQDLDAWRLQLTALAADSARRAQLATAARNRALQLTAARMTDQYLEAYEQARLNRSCASLSSVIPSAPTGIMGMPTFSAA